MKKKLTLKVEELRVEQFQVEPAVAEARGTVHGLQSDADTEPCDVCPRMPITYSCDVTPCG